MAPRTENTVKEKLAELKELLKQEVTSKASRKRVHDLADAAYENARNKKKKMKASVEDDPEPELVPAKPTKGATRGNSGSQEKWDAVVAKHRPKERIARQEVHTKPDDAQSDTSPPASLFEDDLLNTNIMSTDSAKANERFWHDLDDAPGTTSRSVTPEPKAAPTKIAQPELLESADLIEQSKANNITTGPPTKKFRAPQATMSGKEMGKGLEDGAVVDGKVSPGCTDKTGDTSQQQFQQAFRQIVHDDPSMDDLGEKIREEAEELMK